MALVLGERDYKLVTLFTKIAGIFTFAAGSIMLVDHGRVAVGLLLIVLGIVVTLAPVPMTILMPDSVDKAERAEREEELTVNE
jgi:Na+/melibiose symporter-like transporter